MKFAIVSNINNGIGLQRIYEKLRGLLEARGHTVHGEMWNANSPTLYPVDVAIFVEVVDQRWFAVAKEAWLIPMSEWWFYGSAAFPKMKHVLCLTKDCLSIWQRFVGGRARYIGWEAEDLYRPEIPRELKFLHLMGRSGAKNTKAVVEAWQVLPYELTLISHYAHSFQGLPRIRAIGELSHEQLIQEINSHRFHVMPAEYEGYGMALHEAHGCGCITITTDAAPMNELMGIQRDLLVPISGRRPTGVAWLYSVCTTHIADAVKRAAAYTPERLEAASAEARVGFLAENNLFRSAFDKFMTYIEVEAAKAAPPISVVPVRALAGPRPTRPNGGYPPWFGKRN